MVTLHNLHGLIRANVIIQIETCACADRLTEGEVCGRDLLTVCVNVVTTMAAEGRRLVLSIGDLLTEEFNTRLHACF